MWVLGYPVGGTDRTWAYVDTYVPLRNFLTRIAGLLSRANHPVDIVAFFRRLLRRVFRRILAALRISRRRILPVERNRPWFHLVGGAVLESRTKNFSHRGRGGGGIYWVYSIAIYGVIHNANFHTISDEFTNCFYEESIFLYFTIIYFAIQQNYIWWTAI